MLLAFVVLLPFSTDALGEHQEPLATAVFAWNVAVISSTEAVMYRLAWGTGPAHAPPVHRGTRPQLWSQLSPPGHHPPLAPGADPGSSSARRTARAPCR